ncbi:hypothetical protein [Cetobacterium sp.]|uniref:hypothetical protein n=1 Tax=Cetobacterium sp. TaxID=2071632 RepID=UPI003F392229
MLEKIQFSKEESRKIFEFFESEEIKTIYLKKITKKSVKDIKDLSFIYTDKLLCVDDKRISINILKYLDCTKKFNRDTDFYVCYFEKKEVYNFENDEYEADYYLKVLLNNFNLNKLEVFKYRNLSLEKRKDIKEKILKQESRYKLRNQLKIIFAFLNNEQDETIIQNKGDEEYYLKFKIKLEKKKIELEEKNSVEKLEELKDLINEMVKNKEDFVNIGEEKQFYLVDDMTKFIYYYFLFLNELKEKEKSRGKKRFDDAYKLEEHSSNASKYLTCGEFLTRNKVEKYLGILYSKPEEKNKKRIMEELFIGIEKIKKNIKDKREPLDILSEEIRFVFDFGLDKNRYYILNNFIDRVETTGEFLKVQNTKIELMNNQLYFINLKDDGKFMGAYNEALSNEKKYVFINEAINERIISFDVEEIDFVERIISLKLRKEEKKQTEQEKESMAILQNILSI